MKKSFFKKLSFVLALAMIVSVIAPASGAFAATKPAINTAKKYLFLGETGKNEYDFHIDNKVKGSTYKWSSSDESIAVVDAKSGYTTAVANGKATITCKIKAKKKTYTSKTTVIVKNNIKSLAISQKPAGDKLAIGASNAFGTTFTTFGGTQNTTSVIKWAVTDKDGKATTDATISAKGEFTAAKAGTYKVVAAAFQSEAKFTSYTTTQDTKLVLASDTTTVTVAPSIVSVKQYDQDTMKVTFDCDMSKTDLSATTAKVAQVVNGKDVTTGAEKISKLTLDSTGKIATVDLFAAVTQGAVYKFVYGDLSGQFTAATKKIENVTGIIFNDFNTPFGQQTQMEKDNVFGVNSDGVIIYSGTELLPYLTFTYGGDAGKGFTSGNYIDLYTAGTTATVTAKFAYSFYDSTAKVYKTNAFEDSAVATAVTPNTIAASSMQFEIVDSKTAATPSDTNWSGNLTVPAAEQNYVIYARYYTNTSPTTYKYNTNASGLTLVPSDTTKLTITGNMLYPMAAGTVTVVVKDSVTGNAITSFDVTIGAKKTLETLTADQPTVSVGNSAASAKATITFSALDNTGNALTVNDNNTDTGAVKSTWDWGTTAQFVSVPTDATAPIVTVISNVYSGSYKKARVVVDATNHATPGTYQLKVTAHYKNSNGDVSSKDAYVSIIVLDGSSTGNTDVAYWKVDLDSYTLDLNNNFGTSVGVGVYGYNTNGVRVQKLPDTDFTYTVSVGGSVMTDSTTPNQWWASNASGTTITAVKIDSNVAYDKVWWGNWVVTATANAQAAIDTNSYAVKIADKTNLGSATLSVTDSSKKAVTIDKTTAVTGTTILAAVKDAMTFSLNGTTLTDENINKIVYYVGNTKVEATTTAQFNEVVKQGYTYYIDEVDILVANPDSSSSLAAKHQVAFKPSYNYTLLGIAK